MTDPNLPEFPTVECEPHGVEDMGISNEAKMISAEEKIDRLLATAVTVREELITRGQRAAKWLVGLGTAIALGLGFGGGMIWGIRQQTTELRKQADYLSVIATSNKENGDAIRAATSPEASARGRATTAAAINEIRRSIDCVALEDEATYAACVDVVARLNAIRDGKDPFSE